jgi:hypothetical protein
MNEAVSAKINNQSSNMISCLHSFCFAPADNQQPNVSLLVCLVKLFATVIAQLVSHYVSDEIKDTLERVSRQSSLRLIEFLLLPPRHFLTLFVLPFFVMPTPREITHNLSCLIPLVRRGRSKNNNRYILKFLGALEGFKI